MTSLLGFVNSIIIIVLVCVLFVALLFGNFWILGDFFFVLKASFGVG
jgi:hypothetical protein